MPTTYYNEHEPFAAEWLTNLGQRGLIPEGFVDDRDIQKVQPGDVTGYVQCHFFAGIGGWPAALALAGWPADRPVWTGSCPCQPFSVAGKRQGESDERHLWPEFFRLISQCRPATIFGEQVASQDGLRWLDGVFADMEGIDYACGAADLPAAGVGAPDRRQRLFWVANAGSSSPRGNLRSGSVAETSQVDECKGVGQATVEPTGRCGGALHTSDRSGLGGVADPGSPRVRDCQPAPNDGAEGRDQGEGDKRKRIWPNLGDGDSGLLVGMGDSTALRRTGSDRTWFAKSGAWAGCIVVPCLDRKTRRVGRGVQPLAYGIPRSLGRGKPRLRAMVKSARANRVGRLRGYGNAIVPQVAAEFVMAFLETESA